MVVIHISGLLISIMVFFCDCLLRLLQCSARQLLLFRLFNAYHRIYWHDNSSFVVD